MTVPTSPDVVELFPTPSGPLGAAELLARYAPDRAAPRLRVNFVQSVDGSSSLDGLSGGLGGPADKTVFDILRGVSDVVLVGAGTARAEGYGALTVDEGFGRWRQALRMPVHPAMALVSGRLDLDPASELFSKAPRRPLVFTSDAAPAEARRRLDPVAEIVTAGEHRVDPARVVQELHDRGLGQILCEGGPSFFADLIAADLVDELCLTISPVLEGGTGRRIATARETPSVPRHLELAHLLRSDSLLLSRWTRRTQPG